MAREGNNAYPWLTRELYEKTWRRAFLYARKLKHPEEEAKQFAGDAIAEALDPNGSPWTPGMTPEFDSHVCNLLFSAHGNHVQSYAVLKVRTSIDSRAVHRRGRNTYGGNAEEELDDTRAGRLADARYELLLQRVQDDPLVVLLLDDGDGKTSTDRARAAGHSLDDIELARARLKRHIRAVVESMPSLEEEEQDDSEEETP